MPYTRLIRTHKVPQLLRTHPLLRVRITHTQHYTLKYLGIPRMLQPLSRPVRMRIVVKLTTRVVVQRTHVVEDASTYYSSPY